MAESVPMPTLTPEHLDELESGSAISTRTIEEAGLLSERDLAEVAKMTATSKKWWEAKHLPALVFPYYEPGNPDPIAFSVKPAVPQTASGGHELKYIRTKGIGACPYLPPDLAQSERKLVDAAVPLIITEGEKKALSASSAGFACIGVAGVDNWRARKGTQKLHPTLKAAASEGREIYLAYDSDRTTNIRGVRRAETQLAQALTDAGACVFILRIPAGEGGKKQGLDDFLVTHGRGGALDLRRLMKSAKEAGKACSPSGEVGVPEPATGCTDLANAERFVKAHGENIRWVEAWGRWMVWSGRRWVPDDSGRVYQLAQRTVRGIYAEAAAEKDLERRQELGDHARRSESARAVRDMVSLARYQRNISVSPDTFDAQGWLLNCRDGVYDLKSRTMLPHNRSLFCCKRTAFSPNFTTPPKQFLKFLHWAFTGRAELVEYFQRCAGYCLTSDVSEQKLFFLYGGGRNGKSTLLGILLKVMGDYAQKAAPSLLLARDGNDAHPTDIADLKGTRLAVSIEVEKGKFLRESTVKELTGGDRLKARFMRQDFFEFEPTHKLLVACNDKPRVKGTDDGIWRRIRLIPFDAQVADDELDTHLEERLLEQEGDAILAWMVEGCRKWRDHGLGEPEVVTQSTISYREDEDILADFFAERCVFMPHARTKSGNLYKEYCQWCEYNSEQAIKQRTFSLHLASKGLKRVRNNGSWWFGVGLLETDSTDRTDRSDPFLGSTLNAHTHLSVIPDYVSDLSVLSVEDDRRF